ncbi:MAG TPA: restriction endonuclease subunit S [Candidatus Cloacimonadota bacterium]|nr:restriction endonuclease subunit S [Candidatus Cloacimonadota bacterium]
MTINNTQLDKVDIIMNTDGRITKQLSQIADIKVSNVDKKEYVAQKIVLLCNYIDVYSNRFINRTLNFMQSSASESEITKYCLKQGDVVITKDSESPDDIGVPSLIIEEVPFLICGYHLALLRPNQQIIDPLFLMYYLWNMSIHKRYRKYATGATRFGLTLPSIRNMELNIPKNVQDQRKLSLILLTWDQAIEKLEKLIEAKQTFKKTLMQKLLTGQIRFPGFGKPVSQAGELPEGWERTQLKDISQIVVSNVDKKTYPNQKKVLLCNYLDVYQNNYIDDKILFMTATASEDEIKKFSIHEKDIIITKDSETADDIGIPAYIGKDVSNLVCGYHLAIIRSNSDNVYPLYLFNALKSKAVKDYFSKKANGVTRFGLAKGDIENVMLLIPHVEEQKKIAQILYYYDKETENLSQTKNKLQNQKLGLMSLFFK